jgi:hypothetical protein
MRSETSRGPPFLPTMSRSRYTLQVPNRRSPKSATSEHVFVCRRYVSMESLAISAPLARATWTWAWLYCGHQGSSSFVTIWNGKG